MSEQNPSNQTGETMPKKMISSKTGILFILIAIMAFGILYFLLFKTDQPESDKSLSVKPVANKTQNTQAEQTTNVPPVASSTPSQPATSPPAGSGAINVDYEISQMDAQINPVKAEDFNDADVSDANMGL